MGYLDQFGLPDPFAQRQVIPSRPTPHPDLTPLPPPRPLLDDDTAAQNMHAFGRFADTINDIANPPNQKSDDLGRVDDLIKSLGDISNLRQLMATAGASRGGLDARRAMVVPPHQRAMTPMEGPDTGAPNPNAPGNYDDYYRHLRAFESHDNPGIENPTTHAGGYYQFLPGTWADVATAHPELHLTPEGRVGDQPWQEAQQEAAIRAYTQTSIDKLRTALGRDPTPGELYALHLFGHQGGMNLINNMGVPLASLYSPDVINNNPWLRNYKTGNDLLPYFDQLMGG